MKRFQITLHVIRLFILYHNSSVLCSSYGTKCADPEIFQRGITEFARSGLHGAYFRLLYYMNLRSLNFHARPLNPSWQM